MNSDVLLGVQLTADVGFLPTVGTKQSALLYGLVGTHHVTACVALKLLHITPRSLCDEIELDLGSLAGRSSCT